MDKSESAKEISSEKAAMQIHLTLFGIFRDKLPQEARGMADLELAPGTSIAEVLARLEVSPVAVCSVNGELERDPARLLQDGDTLQVFRPAGGGRG